MNLHLALNRMAVEHRNAERDVAAARRIQAAAVASARDAGATWTQIGAMLGVSSQAVWKRYGRESLAGAGDRVAAG